MSPDFFEALQIGFKLVWMEIVEKLNGVKLGHSKELLDDVRV